MHFKMIGYGKSHYLAKSGQQVEWPVVGVACRCVAVCLPQ
jgi:hypothetical protein